MCFAIPRKVEKVNRKTVELEGGIKVGLGGLKRIKPGDYLLVYGNLAISKLDQNEARRTRGIIKQLAQSEKR